VLLTIVKEIATKIGIVTVKNKDTIPSRLRRRAKTIKVFNVTKG
jgi:hypothetical protein